MNFTMKLFFAYLGLALICAFQGFEIYMWIFIAMASYMYGINDWKTWERFDDWGLIKKGVKR